MASLHVLGMKQVGEALKALPEKIKDKVAAKSVMEGSKVIQKAVQQLVPVDSGLLKDSIRVARRRKNVPKEMIQYVVFVRGTQSSSGRRNTMKTQRGSKKGPNMNRTATQVNLPYYWYFLEFGTSKMSKRPFMVPAFASSAQDALNRTRDYARQRIEKEIAKAK